MVQEILGERNRGDPGQAKTGPWEKGRRPSGFRWPGLGPAPARVRPRDNPESPSAFACNLCSRGPSFRKRQLSPIRSTASKGRARTPPQPHCSFDREARQKPALVTPEPGEEGRSHVTSRHAGSLLECGVKNRASFRQGSHTTTPVGTARADGRDQRPSRGPA